MKLLRYGIFAALILAFTAGDIHSCLAQAAEAPVFKVPVVIAEPAGKKIDGWKWYTSVSGGDHYYDPAGLKSTGGIVALWEMTNYPDTGTDIVRRLVISCRNRKYGLFQVDKHDGSSLVSSSKFYDIGSPKAILPGTVAEALANEVCSLDLNKAEN